MLDSTSPVRTFRIKSDKFAEKLYNYKTEVKNEFGELEFMNLENNKLYP